MLINTEEIISIINKKRNEIHKCLSDLDTQCEVRLYDDKNEYLALGYYGIGSSEYGDIVYFDEEVTEADFQDFTINNINIWLNADRATVYVLEDNREIWLSL